MYKLIRTRSLVGAVILSICLSLITPCFAATFTDLQNVIDNNGQYQGEGIIREGDVITLKDDVTQNAGEQTDIKINQGVAIALNLNGHSIIASGQGGTSVLYVNGGSLTLKDEHPDPNSTTGEITGAAHAGVWVDNGGELNMEGGKITGNHSGRGGGVHVQGNSTFNMSGGEITGNTATVGPDSIGGGGGVFVEDGSTFNMEGGTIHHNTANGIGSEVLVDTTQKSNNKNPSKFVMSGGKIQGNSEKEAIGVVGEKSTLVIDGNAAIDGEIFVDKNGTVIGKNGKSDSAGNAFAGFDGKDNNSDESFVVPKGESFVANSGSVTLKIRHEANSLPDIKPPEDSIDVVEIEDPEIPLAEPLTRAKFVSYLWEYQDSPKEFSCTFFDVPEDHEYILALGWAEKKGIAIPNEENCFAPDDLVTIGAAKKILTNYAQVFLMDIDVDSMESLLGDEEEIIFTCEDILKEFFSNPKFITEECK